MKVGYLTRSNEFDFGINQAISERGEKLLTEVFGDKVRPNNFYETNLQMDPSKGREGLRMAWVQEVEVGPQYEQKMRDLARANDLTVVKDGDTLVFEGL